MPYNRANTQLISQIKKTKEDNKELTDEIQKIDQRVKKYEQNIIENDDEIKGVVDDIERYKIMSGYEDIQGAGIKIEINDLYDDYFYFTDSEVLIEKKELLMFIINALNVGNAEAIAINDSRVTNFTEIEVAGNHFEINGVSTNTPFTIKAIGNKDSLRKSVQTLTEDSFFDIKVTEEDNIIIPKQNNAIDFKYAKPANINN